RLRCRDTGREGEVVGREVVLRRDLPGTGGLHLSVEAELLQPLDDALVLEERKLLGAGEPRHRLHMLLPAARGDEDPDRDPAQKQDGDRDCQDSTAARRPHPGGHYLVAAGRFTGARRAGTAGPRSACRRGSRDRTEALVGLAPVGDGLETLALVAS